MPCKIRSLRQCTLIFFNFIFLVTGAAISTAATWAIVSQKHLLNALHLFAIKLDVDKDTVDGYQSSTSPILTAIYVALALGAFFVIVGLFGCCGALNESIRVLTFYAILVFLILTAELVGGATVAAVYNGQVVKLLQTRLADLEKKRFMPLSQTPGNDTSTNAAISSWINTLQILFKCCGTVNQSDITGSGTLWHRSSRVYNNKLQVMPVTCCKMKSNRVELVAKQDWENAGSYLEDSNCPNSGNNSITVGCYTRLDDLINSIFAPTIGGYSALAAIQILCLIMVVCIVPRIRSVSSFKVEN